ncbi:MAG: cation transporter [Gammaproteobacteria bacterium]|nr:cation transporter [Gammaproteobacteria bacterium]
MSEGIQTRFYVENMKCDGCVAKARQAVADLPGIESSEFDYTDGTGSVSGDVDPQAVCAALTAAGYPAVVRSD